MVKTHSAKESISNVSIKDVVNVVMCSVSRWCVWWADWIRSHDFNRLTNPSGFMLASVSYYLCMYTANYLPFPNWKFSNYACIYTRLLLKVIFSSL